METKLTKETTLNEVLQNFNTTEKMYLLSILRGYSESESRDLTKGLFTEIDRYLLDPKVVDMREYFLEHGWRKKEVEDEWKDLLTSHYIEMVLLAGIKELAGTKRNYQLIREATKCAIAQRVHNVQPHAQSYDELILKKHVQR